MQNKAKPVKKPLNNSIERERIEFLRCKNTSNQYGSSRMGNINKENYQRNFQSWAKLSLNKESKRETKAEEKLEESRVNEQIYTVPKRSPIKESIVRDEEIKEKAKESVKTIEKDNDSELPFNLNQKVSGNWLQKYSPYRKSHLSMNRSPLKSPLKSPIKSPYKSPIKSRHKEIVDINYPRRTEVDSPQKHQTDDSVEFIEQRLVDEQKYPSISRSSEISVKDVKMRDANDRRYEIEELAPAKKESFGIRQQDYSPDRVNSYTNKQEKSPGYSGYRDYLFKRNDVFSSDEKPKIYTDKYSNSLYSQNDQKDYEEIKEQSQDRYNQSKGASHILYELYKMKNEPGVDKMENSASQKEVSPKFQETIEKVEPKHNYGYTSKDIDFNEHSAERNESPLKDYGFVFKDNYQDNKNTSFGVPRTISGANFIKQHNIFEDAMDVPMEDVRFSHQQYQSSNQEQTFQACGCRVKHCDRLVKLFKEIVYKRVSKGIETFDQSYIDSLKIEDKSYKKNVFTSDINLNLQKYKNNSKIADCLEESFENIGIDLTKLAIGCRDSEDVMKKCLFSNNKSAIDFFIKEFKYSNILPRFEQLQLVILFHLINQFSSVICESSIIRFILSARRPMIEKQYFAMWINEIYGVNLASISTSSITQPNYLEENEEIIQIRLIALICLFYNIKPTQISSLQLSSIFYAKPHFCIKSHCNNYVLVLPYIYSSYINKLILETETCEKKSCFKTVNNESFRTYCYHDKNRIFLNLRMKLYETMNTIKEKSKILKSNFSEIYNDPLSYIRAFDRNNLEIDGNVPAYLAVKKGAEVPKRLQDSGIYIINSKESEELLEIGLMNKDSFFVYKTRAFVQYSDVYRVNQDTVKQSSYTPKCQCNCSYEVKLFEKSTQIDRNPEMEGKINEIQSLYLK